MRVREENGSAKDIREENRKEEEEKKNTHPRSASRHARDNTKPVPQERR